ncbi:MAG: STAS domain-containing protein [Chloroflexi bacterium]|nr:STAS domain-containing protein [Chloroflexota bacterium]
MALESTLTTDAGVATIILKGELDGGSAPQFRDRVDEAFSPGVRRLVLEVAELEYIASAGIRVLVYAKQKMGADVDIYVVAPQEQVLDTLQKTGIERSVVVVDQYDPSS